MHQAYERYLEGLKEKHQLRTLQLNRQTQSFDHLDFSTNDYLCLSRHPEVIQAAVDSARQYGVGATGSRLLSGNFDLYEAFERQIAIDKQSPSALMFNSGFQANVSALSSLLNETVLGAKPLVFFDKLNHSSLYQAVFLSQAEMVRYRHNAMDHLGTLLQRYTDSPRPKFIVTETVFGMDGDCVPLSDIVQLAQKHGAFLYLDEAHATGLFGPKGYGLSTEVDLQSIPHVVMGTFSKAIGASGGYLACNQILRDYFINKAPGLIYSTAPSPVVVGAAFKAWTWVASLQKEREALQTLGKFLREKLIHHGFQIGTSQTHIVPIIFGDETLCLTLREKLLKEKMIVSCIRPPTVPPGSSRLRIALTTRHGQTDIERLVDALVKGVQG